MTKKQILQYVPRDKRDSIHDAWEDSDGIWIMLKEGWNADRMDFPCRTIHCGGEDEPLAMTVKDLEYQIAGIRKL